MEKGRKGGNGSLRPSFLFFRVRTFHALNQEREREPERDLFNLTTNNNLVNYFEIL